MPLALMPKVIVACEFSQTVAKAFRRKGWDAWSCDLLPTEGDPAFHIEGDIRDNLDPAFGWDLMIAHPDCQYLCSSGLHWNGRVEGRQAKTDAALEFVRFLLGANVPRIALENPIGCISTKIRKPDQIIQPFEYGHPESKSTCLWLKGLPNLVPTNALPLPASGHWENQTPSGQNKLGPSDTRWKDRARTYQGIADAMAEQWTDGHGKTLPVEAGMVGKQMTL